jgi:hypothetical protein
VAFVLSKCAHIVVRISPHLFPIQDEQGHKIVLLDWLKGLHAPDGAICSRAVWIVWNRERIPLRLVALRLSAEQQEKAQRRTKRKASKHQDHVHPNTIYLSGWVLVVTTLPRHEWTDAQVLRLYQARWHIELFFKRIKQLLKVQSLRCTTAATAKPTITLLLIGWVLLEEESAAVRLAIADASACLQQVKEGKRLAWELPDEHLHGPLSQWMLAQASVDLFCQQIRGSSTAQRFRACLPRLLRFLSSGHRDRPHLYSTVSPWLGGSAHDHLEELAA